MAQENPQAQTEVAAGTATFEPTEFEALLNKEFRPKTDQAKSAVQEAVKTLAQQALGRRFFNLRRRSSHHPISRRRTGS